MTKKGLFAAAEAAATFRAARTVLSGSPGWSALSEPERTDRASRVASAAREAARFAYRDVFWSGLDPAVQNRLLREAAAELGCLKRLPADDGIDPVHASGPRPVIALRTHSPLPLEPGAESLPPYPEALSPDFRVAPAASAALIPDDAIERVARAFSAVLGHPVTDVQAGMLVAVSMVELSMPRRTIGSAPDDPRE